MSLLLSLELNKASSYNYGAMVDSSSVIPSRWCIVMEQYCGIIFGFSFGVFSGPQLQIGYKSRIHRRCEQIIAGSITRCSTHQKISKFHHYGSCTIALIAPKARYGIFGTIPTVRCTKWPQLHNPDNEKCAANQTMKYPPERIQKNGTLHVSHRTSFRSCKTNPQNTPL